MADEYSLLFKPYTYEIDSEHLCFKGGRRSPKFESYNFNKPKGNLITIFAELDDKGTYTASNALGASIEVEKTWLHNYSLDFVNSFPLSYVNDYSNSLFEGALIACIKSPPKEAEVLSKKIRLVLGARLRKDSQYFLECTNTIEPTFTDPDDMAEFTRWVNVDFVSLLLVDIEAGEVINVLAEAR